MQIRLGGILGHPGAVLDRHPLMRVPLHAEPGQQPDPVARRLAETVPRVAADRPDRAAHTPPSAAGPGRAGESSRPVPPVRHRAARTSVCPYVRLPVGSLVRPAQRPSSLRVTLVSRRHCESSSSRYAPTGTPTTTSTAAQKGSSRLSSHSRATPETTPPTATFARFDMSPCLPSRQSAAPSSRTGARGGQFRARATGGPGAARAATFPTAGAGHPGDSHAVPSAAPGSTSQV